jgi:hypothetical protein
MLLYESLYCRVSSMIEDEATQGESMAAYLEEQIEWSRVTFGESKRT